MQVIMAKFKETKGSWMYKELNAQGQFIGSVVEGKVGGQLYIRKDSALGKASPNAITVTVEAYGAPKAAAPAGGNGQAARGVTSPAPKAGNGAAAVSAQARLRDMGGQRVLPDLSAPRAAAPKAAKAPKAAPPAIPPELQRAAMLAAQADMQDGQLL